MRKWLLITTAIVGVTFAPDQAQAGPVVAAVGAVSTWWASLAPLAQAAIQLGAGLLISALTRPKLPDQPSLKREFEVPSSRPAKRYNYGRFPAAGTPAPWRVERGILYGCLILNSRPSDGSNFSMTVDGRECVFTNAAGTELPDPGDWGDLTDFTSDGMRVKITESFPDWSTDEDFLMAWLGLGDQSGPPDRLVTEVPHYFAATDAWEGCTVLWVRMSAGNSENRPKRWPNLPPRFEVEMDWSLVWDPDDVSQDRDDPDTWTYSDNQARCLLDAVRQNPVRTYSDNQLYLDTFTDAVAVADEQVLKYYETQDEGSDVFEARYRVAGAIDWTKGELLDLIQPLAMAGAGQLAQSGGRLLYIAGEAQNPVYTETDILSDQTVDHQRYGGRRDVPNAIKGAWFSEERNFETAETDPFTVSDGSPFADDVEELPLSLVPSGTQAQRITKIEAGRRAHQRTLSCVLPPRAMQLVPGSVVTLNLPSPWTRLNGDWIVESMDPGVWLSDDLEEGKVAMRVPVTLREYDGAAIHAWTPATDEQEILVQDLSDSPAALGTVTNLAATTVEVDTGGAFVTMIEYSFDAITDYVVDEYHAEWREDGGEFGNRVVLSPSNEKADGKIYGQFGPVTFDQSYDLGVRALGPTSAGLWSYALGIIAGLEVSSASATAGTNTGTVTVDFTAPDSDYFEGVRLYRNTTGQPFSTAVQVGDDMPCAKNTAHSIEFGDPAPGNLYSDGGFDASGSHTMTGGWSVASSAATHSNPGASGTITQTIAELSAGDTYRFSTSVASTDGASTGHVQLIGSTTVNGDNLGSTGLIRQDLVAPAGVTDAGIYAETDKALSVSMLVIHEVDADDIPLGTADFWIVPYSNTGTNGTPTSLGSLTVT